MNRSFFSGGFHFSFYSDLRILLFSDSTVVLFYQPGEPDSRICYNPKVRTVEGRIFKTEETYSSPGEMLTGLGEQFSIDVPESIPGDLFYEELPEELEPEMLEFADAVLESTF